MRAVAVYSEADADLPFVREATRRWRSGRPPRPRATATPTAVLEAAKQTRAQAIHPGYGFLSENADFAQQVVDAGLVWVGPSPDAIAAMGDKINARNLMAAAGVPVSRGTAEPAADVAASDSPRRRRSATR